jgi:glycosyltransferase involved in cell wall biosynthesis
MNINFNCPINQTGYGIASIGILKALILQGHNVSCFPIGNPSVSSQEEYNLVIEAIQRSELLDIHAPCVKIWHQFDLASHIARGNYIAYPFFELDTFNPREKIHLNIPDKVVVSSEWAKSIVINNNINTPVYVVPLGVDRSIFDYTIPKTRQNNKYVFLTIGKWEVRKGHDLLPSIFSAAFPDNKDVELWILASEHTNSYSKPEEITHWKNLYKSDRIKIFTGVPKHSDIAQLIAESDCGLYVSRAEGWNLELLETMAMNKPVIATNYSAHTEFCTKKNAFLIDIDNIEPAHDKKSFMGQGNWANIGKYQIEQCIEHMRYVYENRISTNLAGIETANIYSWENSASLLTRCITN